MTTLQEADKIADQAQALIGQGRAADALVQLGWLAERFPDIDRFQYRLGLALSAVGQSAAAADRYIAAIRLNPRFPLFHQSLMDELAKSAEPFRAVAAYERAGGLALLSRPQLKHFSAALVAAGAPVEEVLAALPGVLGAHVKAAGVDAGLLGRGLVRITSANAGLEVTIGPEVAARALLFSRLCAFSDYFDASVAAQAPRGTALLCLDDVPPEEQVDVLCFSGHSPNHHLIPDSAFLETDGYRHFHDMAQTCARPWAERSAEAYWRGALTGAAGNLQEVLALPRVALAGLQTPALDAKITTTTQYAHLEPKLSEELAARGALGAREPEQVNFAYRILIDIDGNSNSWPGLFLKLFAEGCVLKLMSPWRQWYYDRLRHMTNMIAIHELAEIPDWIAWCRTHDAQAQDIGRAAGALARSLTPQSELGVFLQAWRAAARSGADR